MWMTYPDRNFGRFFVLTSHQKLQNPPRSYRTWSLNTNTGLIRVIIPEPSAARWKDERGSTIAVSHREFEHLLKIFENLSNLPPIRNAAFPLVQGIYFEGSTLHLLSSILHVSQEHFSLPSLPVEASPDQFFREVFLCAHFVYFTFIFSFLMSCLCFVCGCKVGQG